MNLLIIGNTTSSGTHLKNGLRKYYPELFENIHLVFKEHPTIDGVSDKNLLEPKDYDVVIYNYPFIKTYVKYKDYINNSKILINWWRGTDLRGLTFKNPIINLAYKSIHTIFKNMMFKKAYINLYSTYDLAWWVKTENKKQFFQIIDTDVFKPIFDPTIPKNEEPLILKKGARGFTIQKIEHKQMPKYMNQFKKAEIYPAEGLDYHLINVTVMEALACGLEVKGHKEKDREWAIKNCSIKAGCDRMVKIIKKGMMNNE